MGKMAVFFKYLFTRFPDDSRLHPDLFLQLSPRRAVEHGVLLVCPLGSQTESCGFKPWQSSLKLPHAFPKKENIVRKPAQVCEE